MNDHSNHPRPITERTALRSILAVLLGLAAARILHYSTTQLVHILVFPGGNPAVALVYGSVYRVLGGYIAARFAPLEPMLHALVLGGIEVALVAGVMTFIMGFNPFLFFDTEWYWYWSIMTALPCAWFGGILHQRFHASPKDENLSPVSQEMKRKYALAACACFFSIGVAGLIAAGVLGYGFFSIQNFSDLEIFVVYFAVLTVLLGIYSLLALALGAILNSRAPNEEKRRGERKALVILLLSFLLLPLNLFLGGIASIAIQILPLMLVYAAYGITVMVIAGRCLFGRSATK